MFRKNTFESISKYTARANRLNSSVALAAILLIHSFQVNF
jgi:hypothetical protein